ncbi:splicing factor [Scheffersomyces xylosifermentans]|uniref:splicing factor n=1 Tax=Scheffersomyces xylosifermentans TaxID=1304137 RepID=UPI00315D5676
MEDYEKELLADFDSDEGSDSEEVPVENGFLDEDIDPIPDSHEDIHNGKNAVTVVEEKSFGIRLHELIVNSTVHNTLSSILSEPNIEEVDDLTKFSKVFPLIPELKSHIELYSNEEDTDFLELLSSIDNGNDQSEEYRFVLLINELSTIINQEIAAFHSLVKLQYNVVFPELETLILNPIDYARIIIIIKQDLQNIKSYETEMKAIVSNEKILVIIMAALQQVKNQFILDDKDIGKVLDCCRVILELDDILTTLSTFITSKLSKFAPNVSAIVGSITTSQLLIATGSLRQLALTPACNLPSLGVRDLSSQTKTKSRTIRQTGYLYHSDVVKYLPEDIVRSVMRIISGKVILAARIDLAKSNADGSLGEKYLDEIKQKIEKLLTPPEHQPDKALPAPVDQKSKKRGGRRFRKMKERFQMSELRKAQNKMEFGKQEDSITDSFGEEVGLGMSRSNGGVGRIGEIRVNTNTSARMSKSMVQRLQKQEQNSKILRADKGIFDDDFDSILLANPTARNGGDKRDTAISGQGNSSSKWFTGMTKRKLQEDVNGNDRKKQKSE